MYLKLKKKPQNLKKRIFFIYLIIKRINDIAISAKES